MALRRVILITTMLLVLLLGTYRFVRAQQPQIPPLQVCNKTSVAGGGLVQIASRSDATHTGSFSLRIELTCPAPNGYPTGALAITNLSMTDSIAQGTITAITFEQVTSTGQHSPTVYVNGRCTAVRGEASLTAIPIPGCRYWLMVANNNRPDRPRGTADIVSFLVFDLNGKRMAYGTGTLRQGTVNISPTLN